MPESKPISSRREKAKKLALVYIQTVLTDQQPVVNVAERMPERFGDHKYKRQSVSNRVAAKTVQEEIAALLPKANKEEIADLARLRLKEVLTEDKFEPYRSNASRYVELGLRLNGELVDQSVVRHDIGNLSLELVEIAADQFLDAQFEDISNETGKV